MGKNYVGDVGTLRLNPFRLVNEIMLCLDIEPRLNLLRAITLPK